MPATTTNNEKSTFFILSILIISFVAFAIETDIYVPSFPDMIDALGTNDSKIQQILSINFLGVCISSLIYGPLSDSIGRVKTLSIGTFIFAVASWFCYLAGDINSILFWRFIQGFGAGSILATASTAVFDYYEPTKSARLIAILNSIVTVTMVMAPLVGNYLNIWFNWHAPFLFIFLLATLSWYLITFHLPESLPVEKRRKFNVRAVITSYKELIVNPGFMFNTFVWSLMFSSLIAYTANVSILFIDNLHVAEELFGFYQTATMLGFCVFSLAASYLIGKYGEHKVKVGGSIAFFVGIVAFILVSHCIPTSPNAICSAMFIVGAGTAVAVVPFFTKSMIGLTNVGAAMALAQSLRLLISSLGTDVSRVVFDGSVMSMAYVLAGMAVACLASIFMVEIVCRNK